VTPSESLTENPELFAAMTLSSGIPGVTRDTALIKHLLVSFGSIEIESIRSFVRLKSEVETVVQLNGSFAERTNCRSRLLELLPAVEVRLSVGAKLSRRVVELASEVLPITSFANPPAIEMTSLSETVADLVALNVTPLPLNTGELMVQPWDAVSPAISFKVTDSLKVKETFTLLAMFASLVSELAVTEGLDVFIEIDNADEAVEVWEFRF
jgi:hypothetical protein